MDEKKKPSDKKAGLFLSAVNVALEPYFEAETGPPTFISP
ncbi:MAG: hypothetical protein ACJATV_000988 [Granulosicoccus sp.]|jgi:hypothetical protein